MKALYFRHQNNLGSYPEGSLDTRTLENDPQWYKDCSVLLVTKRTQGELSDTGRTQRLVSQIGYLLGAFQTTNSLKLNLENTLKEYHDWSELLKLAKVQAKGKCKNLKCVDDQSYMSCSHEVRCAQAVCPKTVGHARNNMHTTSTFQTLCQALELLSIITSKPLKQLTQHSGIFKKYL